MPEQEPPLEIWRISVQGLLPAPNGAYTGCKAAGRGEERSPGGSGADASPKKAGAPPRHQNRHERRRHKYVAPLRFPPVGACPEVSLRPHMNFDNRHCGILRRDPTINDQKTTPPRKCRDGGQGAKVARFFSRGVRQSTHGGPQPTSDMGAPGEGAHTGRGAAGTKKT